MKRKTKLAFDQLVKELNPLDFRASAAILGGYSSGGGGYWGWSNGEYVFTYNGGTIDEVVITAGATGTGYSAWDAIGTMLTSVGIAADHGRLSATILQLERIKALDIAGRRFGIAGVISNAIEFWNDPNWEDGAQMALGVALLGSGGTLAIAAGIGLGIWEIIEIYQQTSGSTGNPAG